MRAVRRGRSAPREGPGGGLCGGGGGDYYGTGFRRVQAEGEAMADGRTTSSTLLERVRNRDQAAWQRLMYLYAPLVRYWCGRWGLHGADADDVVQEVFQGVAGKVAAFRRDRPADTFRGWLRGITRHKVLDARRARQRHPVGAGGTDAHLRLEQYADPDAEDGT